MIHQQHKQQQQQSKTPLLLLGGAAALMIQGLLVIPANAETTNTNDAGNKVSFDLGVHHNLQAIGSLSTGGSGPAGAGPQLWGFTSASIVSNANNTSTPSSAASAAVSTHQGVVENASIALYRKIRLEDTMGDTANNDANTALNVGGAEEAEDIISGEDALDEVTVDQTDIKKNKEPSTIKNNDDDDKKELEIVVVEDTDKTKKDKVTTEGETVDGDMDEDDQTGGADKKVAVDSDPETETETEAETDVKEKEESTARDEHPASSERSKTSSLDTTGSDADKKTTTTKPAKDEPPQEAENDDDDDDDDDDDEKEQEDEEDGDKKKAGSEAVDKKKDQGDKKINDDNDDEEDGDEKDKNVSDSKGGPREPAFAKLREQLLKQQQEKSPSTTSDNNDSNINDDSIKTLVRAADFVPQEDMQAVMNAKATKDNKDKGTIKTLPLTPQQIADTEHQGANAFFELFAADIFPDLKLVGNNQLQDLDFEQRLSKQKQDRKSKAAKAAKATKKEKKDNRKKSDKKDKKQQQDQNRHLNEKRAVAGVADVATDASFAANLESEKEHIHAVLESIFGKAGTAAKVDKAKAEEMDNADFEATTQGGLHKDAADSNEEATIFDEDLNDDEPIRILGVGKKGPHKKHHHMNHGAAATTEDEVSTVFSIGDDAKDAKDAKDTKDTKESKDSKPTADTPPNAMKPNAGGPSAGQPQPKPQPQQHPQPASSASAPAGAPPAGAKDGPSSPAKGLGKDGGAGTAGFGAVPMFGPAQLDLGNGTASSLASKTSIVFAVVFGIAWMAL
ncbi:hypothetical protein BGX23_004134 [Mortierella sp. AD031]|nr:hypothetical protein BGX23_004134 [Mortierella sp. AD031]